MGFGDLFGSLGMWSSMYSYVDDQDEFDMESFMTWLHASDVERERMELTMTEEGKIAFREKAKKLGFFNDEE